MTIPRLSAMQKYWKQNPPLHQIVAAYSGHKAPEEKPAEANDIEAFIRTFGNVGQ